MSDFFCGTEARASVTRFRASSRWSVLKRLNSLSSATNASVEAAAVSADAPSSNPVLSSGPCALMAAFSRSRFAVKSWTIRSDVPS